MKETKKKYGLLSGIAMVIGIVIGAGVFIKGGDVLRVSGGSLPLSLLAWLVGGIIMIVSAFCFAIYSSRVVKFNGCVDYVEHATNESVGYFFGYYLAKIYFPIFSSVVAVVAAQNVVAIFAPNGEAFEWMYEAKSPIVLGVAAVLITIFFLLNYFAPRIANRYQVSMLVVKLLPLAVIAVAGLFSAFIKGAPGIIKAFSEVATPADPSKVVNSFGEAIKISSFAYDGWVCVTTLNAEMKDSKKNMPRAIIIGTVAIVIFYLIYFIGASAIIGNTQMVEDPVFAGARIFLALFGVAGQIIFLLFLFFSCTGNINAMTLCCSRSFISLGYRGQGFRPKEMCREKNDKGDYGLLPYLLSYIFSLFFLLIWFLAYNDIPFFTYLSDFDTITCSSLYGVFIVVYINIMRKFKEENFVVRYIMPIIAIAGSVFFCLCGTGLYQLIVNGDTRPLISFGCSCVVVIILMLPGVYFYLVNKGVIKKHEK